VDICARTWPVLAQFMLFGADKKKG